MSNYIGNQPAFGEFKKLDSIVSSFNGSTTQFNLEHNSVGHTIGDATQLIVSLNGVIQEPGTAYTLGLGGGSIVFSSAPASTDTCHIVSLGGVGGTTTPTDGSVTASKLDPNLKDYLEETFTANGTQTVFTLTRAAIGSNSLLLSVDGIVQPSTAYSVAGTTLTISPALPNTTNVRVVHLGVQSGVYIPAADSITSNQLATLNGNLNFDDNAKAVFGEGSDLQIYHDGSNSYVKDAGTGNLNLQGENLALENTSGDNYFVGVNGSFVKIYYSGSEKLATTSTGIDVTGTVTSTGLIGNATNFDIRQNTSDGSDSKRTRIGGGGDVISSRGAMIEMSGNEHGNGGMLFLSAGHGGAYSQIRSYTSNIERMRIDSSGNVLVGKTAMNGNTAGIQVKPAGELSVVRDANHSLILNRKSSNGNIALFQKDGSTVGSMGVADGDNIYIASDDTNDVGLKFNGDGNRITPCNALGADRGSAIDLGEANSGLFKDLYLSGGIQFDARSNKLDDYEEGNWTPSILVENAGAAGITVNHAAYTKIGRLVSLVFDLTINSVTGTNSSRAIQLEGMPFTINTAYGGGPNIGYTNLTNSMSGNLALQGRLNNRYRIVNLNGATGQNASDHIQATTVLRGQFTYHTDQ